MKHGNVCALIIGYFLSRFNERAYAALGYGTQTATHEAMGRILDVPPALVKNIRDQFDSVHDNPRVGWYQRPLPPSRQRVLEMHQGLDFGEVLAVVHQVLSRPGGATAVQVEALVEIIRNAERMTTVGQTRRFGTRAVTGRLAEEYFITYHRDTGEPFPGELVDTRDLGCGYDFQINSPEGTVFIEVKGLDGGTGGMMFTSREWETALEHGPAYIVALVREVGAAGSIVFYRDPVRELSARPSISTVVQVRWLVSIRPTEVTRPAEVRLDSSSGYPDSQV